MTAGELIELLKGVPTDADILCNMYDEDEDSGWILNCEAGELQGIDLIDPLPEIPNDTHSVGLNIVRWREPSSDGIS